MHTGAAHLFNVTNVDALRAVCRACILLSIIASLDDAKQKHRSKPSTFFEVFKRNVKRVKDGLTECKTPGRNRALDVCVNQN